jgi:hypothetical protein
MRYGLDSTLPINAFSPRGGRGPFSLGMTLEGGGGGIPIISDVVNVVSDVGEAVGGAIGDVGEAVGGAVGDVGSFIDDSVIQPAIQDPVGTAVKIGAIAAAPATGGTSLYAIPAYTATKAIAAGVPIEDVAKMTAISAAATAAGVSVADYVGTLAEFGTEIGSQQTAMLAAQNVGIGTGNVASTTAGQIAGGATSGAIKAGATGGDIDLGLLSGAASGAIGTGVGATVDAAANSGLFNNVVNQANTGTTGMDELFNTGEDFNMGGAGFNAYAQQFGGTGEDFNMSGGAFYNPNYSVIPGELGDIIQDANGNIVLSSGADIQAAQSLGFDTTTLTNYAKQFGTQALKALLGGGGTAAQRAMGQSQGGLLGAGANYLLSGQAGRAIQSSAAQSAQQQRDAAALAQQQASFTPVGMTTAFGSSNFGFDPTTGKLTSAGYTPTSQVAGQVQNLFGLGASALPTTTNTQDVQQQYIAQQQGLLAPGREQQLAQLRNRQYQRGTTGLATGGTMAGYAPNAQGLMATNPEMAAFYNAQAQENARLASNAPTYAQNLLNSQIATGTNLFGAANTLEGYAQQPLSLSTALGTAGATAGARSGQLGLLGNLQATQTQQEGNIAAATGRIGGTAGLLTAANPLLANLGNAINTSIWG